MYRRRLIRRGGYFGSLHAVGPETSSELRASGHPPLAPGLSSSPAAPFPVVAAPAAARPGASNSPGALEPWSWRLGAGRATPKGPPSAAHHPSSPIGALPWHATTTGRQPALFSLPSPERDCEKTQPTTTIDDDERFETRRADPLPARLTPLAIFLTRLSHTRPATR